MTDPDTLRRQLNELGASFEVPPEPELEAVRSRGQAVRRRRGVAVAVSGATAFGCLAAAVSLVVASGDAPSPVSAGAPLAREGDVGIDWQVQSGDPASRIDTKRFPGSPTGTGPLYAVSTGAGERDVSNASRVVWRSDDGIAWSASTTLDDGLFLGDLEQSGQRLYAVGTGTAEQVTGTGPLPPPLVAAWSDDGGTTWDHVELPADTEAIAEHANVFVGSPRVVTGSFGTLVLADILASPDVTELLPAGATVTDGWIQARDGSGIDLLGPRVEVPCVEGQEPEPGPADPAYRIIMPCPDPEEPAGRRLGPNAMMTQAVTASYTWDELGVGSELLEAIQGRPKAFLAPPGSTTFEPVSTAGIDPVPGQPTELLKVQAFAVPDGVVASVLYRALPTAGEEVKTVLLHSVDGRTWQPWSPPPFARVDTVGVFGGNVYVVGSGLVARLTPSGVWSVTDLAELLGGTAQDLEVTATIGPNGITVVTEDRGNGTDGGYGKRLSVAVTRDGVTWQTWDLGDLVGREPMGRHLVTVDYVGDQIVVDVGVLPEGASMPTFGPGSALSMVPPPSERVSLVGTPR